MSMIPDYVSQVQEVARQLEAQALVTATQWSDSRRKEFYDRYIEPMLEWIDTYVNGSSGARSMQGMGLDDLLQFMDEQVSEFEAAGGSASAGIGFFYGSMPQQIMVSPRTSRSEVQAMPLTSSNGVDIPEEQAPDQISKNRTDWTVDYNLNSPGNFSAQNLREILNRRRNN